MTWRQFSASNGLTQGPGLCPEAGPQLFGVLAEVGHGTLEHGEDGRTGRSAERQVFVADGLGDGLVVRGLIGVDAEVDVDLGLFGVGRVECIEDLMGPREAALVDRGMAVLAAVDRVVVAGQPVLRELRPLAGSGLSRGLGGGDGVDRALDRRLELVAAAGERGPTARSAATPTCRGTPRRHPWTRAARDR